jgi:2-hydroxy-3-keto-5-methylthiopentenyl-1-phosphate phosphatase
LSQGYRVIYVGNGVSDSYASRHANVVFATGDLLNYYRVRGMDCIPFDDLTQVVSGMSKL